MLSEPLTLYKLMILYMLKQVKFPLTNSQILEFFQSKDYTDPWTLQRAISELLEAHLIKKETIRNSSLYEITREGEETLVFFGSNISPAIVEDMNVFLKENKLRLRDEVGIVADYYKSTNKDYIAQCEIREGKGTLIQLHLSVPDPETAETVCDNWMECNQDIYAYIMQQLLRERH